MKKVVLVLVASVCVALMAFGQKVKMPLPKNTKIFYVGGKSSIKTIEDALERVARWREGNVKIPIAICLAPGDYRPPSTIVISKAHASADFAPLVIYAADFSKKPRILGDMPITKWKKVPFNGRNDVWCASAADLEHLPPKRTSLRLFVNGKRMQPARWPNLDPDRPFTSGYAITLSKIPDDQEFYEDEIRMRPEDLRKWRHPDDGVVIARQRHNFDCTYSQMRDCHHGIIYIERPHNKLAKTGLMSGCLWDRYQVENMAEELDLPGEWYLDPRTKMVYLIPPDGIDPNKATVSIAKNGDMIQLKGASNCVLAGLELTACGTAVKIEGSRNVVAGCTIRETGASGVWMVGLNNRVTDCDIYNIGSYGIFIHSHWQDRLVDKRSNNLIENNYIHHCGEIVPVASGIFNACSGVKMKHNLFHDMPRTAITGYGRFCEISYNRIRHTNTQNDDTGAMYDCCWAQACGSHICYNWISDSIGFKRIGEGRYRHYEGACGIYFDECTGGAFVYGNLIENCRWAGIFLHNARWLTISNNVFVANGWQPVWHDFNHGHGSHQIAMSPWSREGFKGKVRDNYATQWETVTKADPRWLQMPSLSQNAWTDEVFTPNGTMIMGTRVVNNIVYYPSQGIGPALFAPTLDTTTNFFNRNIYWPGESGAARVRMSVSLMAPADTWEIWQQEKKQDRQSLVVDPLFRNPAKKDFRLKPDSPAFKLGIKEIPQRKMGLKKTRFRPVLPKEAEGVREHPEWLTDAKGNHPAKPPQPKRAKKKK